MPKKTALILALGLAAGGCTHLSTSISPDARALVHENLKNAQGHVIGYMQVARDAASGERITQLTLFVPRLNERGRIVGYEERVRGGTVLHDLDGRRVGGSFVDLRSRKSLTIVVLPRDERVARLAAPSLDELIRLARLDN